MECTAIFLFALIYSLGFNFTNLGYVKSYEEKHEGIQNKTVYGYTLFSLDNFWYVPQAQNMYAGKGYTMDPREPEYRVRRSPGYSIFLYLHMLLFGEKGAFAAIRYSQALLFALSAVLLFSAILRFSGVKLWAYLSTGLYILSPYLVSYLFTTVTEALYPAFLIFMLYFTSRFYQRQRLPDAFLAGILLSASVLIRPVTGIFLPFLVLILALPFFFRNSWRGIFSLAALKPLSLFGIGFMLLLFPWAIRNYVVTKGEIIILEKYYHGAPMGLGRGYVAFRGWVSSWENSANLVIDQVGNAFYHNALQDKLPENEALIREFTGKVPAGIAGLYSTGEMEDAMRSLADCFAQKAKRRKQNDNYIPRKEYLNLPCEDEAKAEFSRLENKVRSEAPFWYYIGSPLYLLKTLIFQSGTFNISMLNPMLPGQGLYWWQKAAKAISYLLNIALFLSFFGFLTKNLFVPEKEETWLLLLNLAVLAYLFLICFIMRHPEARYLVLAYPVFFVTLGYWASRFFTVLKQKLFSA